MANGNDPLVVDTDELSRRQRQRSAGRALPEGVVFSDEFVALDAPINDAPLPEDAPRLEDVIGGPFDPATIQTEGIFSLPDPLDPLPGVPRSQLNEPALSRDDESVEGFFGEASTFILEGTFAAFETVGDFFSDATDAAVEFGGDAVELVKAAGSAVGNAVVDTIDAVTGVGENVREGARSLGASVGIASFGAVLGIGLVAFLVLRLQRRAS